MDEDEWGGDLPAWAAPATCALVAWITILCMSAQAGGPVETLTKTVGFAIACVVAPVATGVALAFAVRDRATTPS